MQAPTLYICPGCPHPHDGSPASSDNGPPPPSPPLLLRCLWSLSFHSSTTDCFFLCVCLFVLEQHIMATAHLSGLYLLRRRRHLQAGPLPQSKVRLSEGETLPFFQRSSIKPRRHVYGSCNTSSASQCNHMGHYFCLCTAVNFSTF